MGRTRGDEAVSRAQAVTLISDAQTINTKSTIGPRFNARTSNKSVRLVPHFTTKVPFDATRFDNEYKFDKTLNRFKPGKTGCNFVNVYLYFKSSENTYYTNVYLYKNGTMWIPIAGGGGTGAAYTSAVGSTLMELDAEDYIEIFASASIDVAMEGIEFSATFLHA